MISLRNDLYAHIILAAQKHKPLIIPPISEEIPEPKTLPAPTFRAHPIDEKMDDDPKVLSCKNQLALLESQFHALRATADPDTIWRIENRIITIRKLLQEKSYL